MVSPQHKFSVWLLHGMRPKDSAPQHEGSWWNVMCLTGVDYFSTLGYQPGIAFIAAGQLAPLATLILVVLTLLGALPVYFRVARESFHGQGSISMLERLLPGWRGKALVLVLLGFAATSFVITITLSAADATAHIIENPWFPKAMANEIGITLALLLILAGVFLMGFQEAIGIAVIVVWVYLALNAVVIGRCVTELQHMPEKWMNWQSLLHVHYPQGFWMMLAISMGLFPKLALGLSGFETGVSVMPLVRGSANDDPAMPKRKIFNTRLMLFCAALIMSVYLMSSAMVTTLLIPAAEFSEQVINADGSGRRGQANGRALAYLAHQYMGSTFGTVYDVSTILILWFAGASAIVGLLNLVPRYLPRYGMAPEWARASRPLVLFITAVACVVTIVFKADVDDQAGAYATGVLSLITSAAVAVTLSAIRDKQKIWWIFGVISSIFIYTTAINIIERPEGLQIAMFFVAAILFTSMTSRSLRSLELRIGKVQLDESAKTLIANIKDKEIRLLAHRPDSHSDYDTKEREARRTHTFERDEGEFVFLEVFPSDRSEFMDDCLEVSGHEAMGYKILRCSSPAVPNAIAALLLHLRDESGKMSHVYMGWTEGHPLGYIFKYIFFGEGETAPVTREVLRRVEHDVEKRPKVHVG